MIFELNGGRWHCGLDVFFHRRTTDFGVGKFRFGSAHLDLRNILGRRRLSIGRRRLLRWRGWRRRCSGRQSMYRWLGQHCSRKCDGFEVIHRLSLHFTSRVKSSKDRVEFVLVLGLKMTRIVINKDTLNEK
jgi:hypothetical protein